jgi:6-pyruvoyltetrahydropterin/6-carboxytetrahydropterin synthase
VREDAGWVMDFSLTDEAFDKIRPWLDHRLLNETPGLENPTCENLALWIWSRLSGLIPNLSGVRVQETADSACLYEGEA